MTVVIRAEVVRDRDNSILIDYDGEQHWLPKSQILGMAHLPSCGLTEIRVTDWIAAQKGFTLVEEVFVASTQTGNVATPLHSIRMNGQLIGYAPDQKRAIMIAAALNMTIGKV